MTSTESPLSVTFKPHTGFDAPLLTIRADSPDQLVERLNLIQSNDLLAATGRVANMFGAQFNLGKGVGGQHVNNPDGSGGGSAPVAAPPAPAPVAPPAPVDPWGGASAAQGVPPQAQQYQPAGLMPPQQQYPQPVAQAAPAAPTPPGAPLVLGQPAQYKEGVSAKTGKTWRKWSDPRPWRDIAELQDTDQANHPGLAAGTHRFTAWIR